MSKQYFNNSGGEKCDIANNFFHFFLGGGKILRNGFETKFIKAH